MINKYIKNFKVALNGLMEVVSSSYIGKYKEILMKSLRIICFWSPNIALFPQCGLIAKIFPKIPSESETFKNFSLCKLSNLKL